MTKKPDAIVFFDLDGTLFDSNIEVLPSSYAAIERLKQNNIIPMIATGRTPMEAAKLMKDTGINSIIAMNGQVVIYEKEVIFTNNIDKNVITRLYEFSREKMNIPLSFYNYNKMRVSEINQATEQFYHSLKLQIPPVDDQFY